ncbi:MAG: PEGA domain-containing protein [Methanophagales archaeon]|nr:PEGA domain-containing protein [Methanophagales archaeon]
MYAKSKIVFAIMFLVWVAFLLGCVERSTTGSVFLSSEPSGAEIWIDDFNTKKVTPAIINGLSEEKHSYILKKEGYKDKEGVFLILAGETVSIDIVLEAIVTTTTPTPTQTIIPTPIHPIGCLIFHQADEKIAYNWFSYVPASLTKVERGYILITGVFGAVPPTDNYSQVTEQARAQARGYLGLAETKKYILLIPVIPRPSTNHVYAVAFDWKVFLSSSDPFVQRPDMKVNLMIDRLRGDLQRDGYNVHEKVFVEGFSAGGMFAQRYALLHPARVQAIAAGQSGGSIVLPESSYNGIELDWPVAVNDFPTLVGYKFDQATYKQVPQFIYIGDQDTKNSTLRGAGELWRTQSQIDFLNTTFGATDPIRLRNQCDYLKKLGYNITFKEYAGIGHQFTNQMLDDVFAFFSANRY